jgi:hypothetical protein
MLGLCTLGTIAAGGPAAVRAQTAAPAPPAAAQNGTLPTTEEIYTRVRSAWRRRAVPPFTRYTVTAVYQANGRTFRDDFQAFYGAADGRVMAYNVPLPPQESRARTRGFPITILGYDVDTNPAGHPPLRIPTPRIAPYAPLGLGTPGSLPESAAGPQPSPSPEVLRELGRVVTVARTYAVTFVGVEMVNGTSAYHLRLTPLRNPNVYKLRDLWADARTFEVERLEVAGITAITPLAQSAARIDFKDLDGKRVIARIAALEPLRVFHTVPGFGSTTSSSSVQHLVYAFREYQFPEHEDPAERYQLNFTPPSDN